VSDTRYPIGRFEWFGAPNSADHAEWIEEIAQAPALLRADDSPSGAPSRRQQRWAELPDARSECATS
jgi:hypothetical protein